MKKAAFIVVMMILSIAQADVIFSEGTFGTVAHGKVDSVAVAAYLTNAASIKAGTLTNVTEYEPAQMAMWKDSYGNWTQGGMGACVTVVSNLQAGDIAKVEENWLFRENSSQSYESFYAFTAYMEVSSYTHNSTQTINTWINCIQDNGDGSYNLIKGSAFFNESDGSAEELASFVGNQYLLNRTITIYREGTLLSPATNWRGYTTGNGVSGGSEIGTYSWSPELTIVPEPATMVILSLGGLLLKRKK